MKVNVFDLNGNAIEQVELPEVFKTDFRPDLIQRAVLALQSHRKQPFGSDPLAGLRTAVHYHGKRRERFAMINIDRARLPRIHGSSPHLAYRVRRVPQAVKGRRAHPPKVEKVPYQKINKKENKLALKSALAASANLEIVKQRGHLLRNVKAVPLIVSDDIQSVAKTKEIEKILSNLGLKDELERVKERKVKAGKGKLRGRKYKEKKGPLIVVKGDKSILKAGNNMPGIDVKNVKKISVEDLAPGALAGRLVIFSKSSVEELKGM